MKRSSRLYSNDLRKLSSDLKNLAKDLDKGEKTINNKLIEVGVTTLIDNVEQISNYDGNLDFNITNTDHSITFEGSQVMYLEYGTGQTGKSSVKSQFQPQNYVHSDKKKWIYKSKKTGAYTPSYGIPAFMPMTKMYVELNGRKRIIVNQTIKEMLNRNGFH